jgi:choline dehydrogenase-like flavoprotein
MKETVAAMYESIGLPRIPDNNAGDSLGYSETSSSTYDGIRQWACAYPRGKNVTLWANTLTIKILIKDKQATGVEVLKDGDIRLEVLARHDVIVASGAQGSPKLLLLRYVLYFWPHIVLLNYTVVSVCRKSSRSMAFNK